MTIVRNDAKSSCCHGTVHELIVVGVLNHEIPVEKDFGFFNERKGSEELGDLVGNFGSGLSGKHLLVFQYDFLRYTQHKATFKNGIEEPTVQRGSANDGNENVRVKHDFLNGSAHRPILRGLGVRVLFAAQIHP